MYPYLASPSPPFSRTSTKLQRKLYVFPRPLRERIKVRGRFNFTLTLPLPSRERRFFLFE